MHKQAVGENYEKLKQKGVKPPSFLEKGRQKKKLLLYVDVNITPTRYSLLVDNYCRTGRIGIYEGDNIRDLAKNF